MECLDSGRVYFWRPEYNLEYEDTRPSAPKLQRLAPKLSDLWRQKRNLKNQSGNRKLAMGATSGLSVLPPSPHHGFAHRAYVTALFCGGMDPPSCLLCYQFMVCQTVP